MAREFLRLLLDVPAVQVDHLIAELWVLGTRGIETVQESGRNLQLLAYFGPDRESDRARLVDRLRQVVPGLQVSVSTVPFDDWLTAYRQKVRPFAVGRGWWIDPREPGAALVQPPSGRSLIRLPARSAFGTGSHASTALAIELLEELPVRGKRVLDVGTGTGILAIVALKLGAAPVVACDLDPMATFLAQANAHLNRADFALWAGRVDALDDSLDAVSFDLVVANLLLEELHSDLPVIAGRLARDGRWIVSGLLASQEGTLAGWLRELGLEVCGRRRAEEWVACVIRRASS